MWQPSKFGKNKNLAWKSGRIVGNWEAVGELSMSLCEVNNTLVFIMCLTIRAAEWDVKLCSWSCDGLSAQTSPPHFLSLFSTFAVCIAWDANASSLFYRSFCSPSTPPLLSFAFLGMLQTFSSTEKLINSAGVRLRPCLTMCFSSYI